MLLYCREEKRDVGRSDDQLARMFTDATRVMVVLADAERRPDCTLEVTEVHWEPGVVGGEQALWFRVTEGSTVGVVWTIDPVHTPW
jgi:hypothetical protein